MFAQETSLTDNLNSEREKCILTTFFFHWIPQIEMWGLGGEGAYMPRTLTSFQPVLDVPGSPELLQP